MVQRVLLVDDDESIRRLVGFRLRNSGYEVIEAADGDAAVEVATLERPDAIILDVMMPGQTGFEVIHTLRALEQTRRIPIMIVTSRSQERDVLHGFRLGANDYLTKPFRPAELVARLEAILRQAATAT